MQRLLLLSLLCFPYFVFPQFFGEEEVINDENQSIYEKFDTLTFKDRLININYTISSFILKENCANRLSIKLEDFEGISFAVDKGNLIHNKRKASEIIIFPEKDESKQIHLFILKNDTVICFHKIPTHPVAPPEIRLLNLEMRALDSKKTNTIKELSQITIHITPPYFLKTFLPRDTRYILKKVICRQISKGEVKKELTFENSKTLSLENFIQDFEYGDILQIEIPQVHRVNFMGKLIESVHHQKIFNIICHGNN